MAGVHDYFDTLRARSDCLYQYSCRNRADDNDAGWDYVNGEEVTPDPGATKAYTPNDFSMKFFSGDEYATLTVPSGLVTPTSVNITSGTVTGGSVASLAADDGTYHTIQEASGALDLYYESDTTNFMATAANAVVLRGYLQGSGTVRMDAWRWGTSVWETINATAYTGGAGGTDIAAFGVLTSNHRQSGTDNVRVRVYGTGLGAGTVLALDKVELHWTVIGMPTTSYKPKIRVANDAMSGNVTFNLYGDTVNTPKVGAFLLTFDHWFDDEWADWANNVQISAYKCWQLGAYHMTAGQWWEMRTGFQSAPDDGSSVAVLDARASYNQLSDYYGQLHSVGSGAEGAMTNNDGVAPQSNTTWAIQKSTWTRFYVWFEFLQIPDPDATYTGSAIQPDAWSRMSMWVCDEDRDPVILFDRVAFNAPMFYFDGGQGAMDGYTHGVVHDFWFEHDSSSSKRVPVAPNYNLVCPLYMRARNVALLDATNISSVTSLFQKPLGDDAPDEILTTTASSTTTAWSATVASSSIAASTATSQALARAATLDYAASGPTLVTITGSLFHPSTGAKITSGELRIKPKSCIRSDGLLISAAPVTVSVPGTGDLSFQLVPSGGVLYAVEFDPTPNDSATPLSMKSGYWKGTWTVPGTGPVNITSL